MTADARNERGQAALEFGVICSLLLVMTVGLIDVGRMFLAYNDVSAVARYGARWGSVVGGTCGLVNAKSTADWCNQVGTYSGQFWTLAGNKPRQGFGVDCPQNPTTAQLAADYWPVSPPPGGLTPAGKATTIVGAIAQRFDTSQGGFSGITGGTAPGINLHNIVVCIATSNDPTNPGETQPLPGDTVSVAVHYQFNAASGLVFRIPMNLNASSEYRVE